MKFFKFIDNKVKLSGSKNFVAIIGNSPSKGARSPILWNRAFKNLKINKRMYPFDTRKKNLRKLIFSLKKNSKFYGCSVTAPHKVSIMKYLDTIDEDARKIGSVNTVVKKNSKLTGYNTDYYGTNYCLDFIKKKNRSYKNILIIGCGGAGKACIVSALDKFPNSKFHFFNRNFNKIKSFLNKLDRKIKWNILRNNEELSNMKFINLVINTSSVGFDSNIQLGGKYFNLLNQIPLGKVSKIDVFTKFQKKENNKKFIKLEKDNIFGSIKFFFNNPKTFVFDIIYNPQKSLLLQLAELFNLKTLNGISMNLMQAIYAFQLVNNIDNINKIKKAMVKNGQ